MNYTLHLGDCLDILPTLEAQSVDAIIADPPYGTTACKWDSVIPFDAMWRELKRVIKPCGAIVLFGSQPFTSALVMSNVKWFRYSWVWDKKTATGGADSDWRPMRAHEDICIFSDSQTRYNPQMEDFTEDEVKRMRKHDFTCNNLRVMHGKGTNVSRGWYEGKQKYPRTLIRINGLTPVSREKQAYQHPTQKPLALLEYLVKTYTNEGQTVLDFTMGSGTTGEACVNTGRDFIGIERDAHYYDIASARLDAAAARMVQTTLEGVA